MIKSFIKHNFLFFVGLVFGSVIGTTTTIMVTMGMFGAAETIEMYQSSLCDGSNK